jgi:hypothetical protein
MCDYSLHGVATRPAKVGDKLETRQFWNTTTRGFSAIEEPAVAVCLLPGTEVGFEREVERELTGFQLIFLRRRKGPSPTRSPGSGRSIRRIRVPTMMPLSSLMGRRYCSRIFAQVSVRRSCSSRRSPSQLRERGRLL